ncbi:rhodanese-like domain-containing protein [Variovorax sp. J22R115]|uniref:rhodanese-like domain-containing protein n=1 Tax=Variovorax sp. J22R115 TaxID=3053509 RepID=UPI002578E1DF|nr:rhodanese-like domain-containing protein [Variovorax sp. J22R115]MDM0047991.1 rhodanese-like domain-containing protein [Variovorax sp. J22R115]
MSDTGISPQALRDLLLGPTELALLDVREARWFNAGHPNLARLAPLSVLELQIDAFVPRRGTDVVIYDANDADDGPAAAAAALLCRLGYSGVRRLAGGLQAWKATGYPVINGYNTLVKAFGDGVRQRYETPVLPLAELEARRRSGKPTTVIDARPREEYEFLSIEGARSYSGTELALRRFAHGDPEHLWAINCFSRTRGIIGTTTLRLLGRAPDAVFVEDGVMAWGLRGAPVVQNAVPVDDVPAEEPAVLRGLAEDLRSRYGLKCIDASGLGRLRAESGRTLYVFDVRPLADPAKAAACDARHVPGGQLLMHFENLVGTRNARIVLVDDAHLLRASVTAFWLTQLNQAEVHVLEGELPTAMPVRAPHEAAPDQVPDAPAALDADPLAHLLDAGLAQVVDVGPSMDYERGHLPGAYFLLPASLTPLEVLLPSDAAIVFTSPDGAAARLAARDARRRWPEATVAWLKGGTQAWQARGHAVESEIRASRLLTPFDDDWGSVMRVFGPRRDAVWDAYLQWERGLGSRVARDSTVQFRFLREPVSR